MKELMKQVQGAEPYVIGFDNRPFTGNLDSRGEKLLILFAGPNHCFIFHMLNAEALAKVLYRIDDSSWHRVGQGVWADRIDLKGSAGAFWADRFCLPWLTLYTFSKLSDTSRDVKGLPSHCSGMKGRTLLQMCALVMKPIMRLSYTMSRQVWFTSYWKTRYTLGLFLANSYLLLDRAAGKLITLLRRLVELSHCRRGLLTL